MSKNKSRSDLPSKMYAVVCKDNYVRLMTDVCTYAPSTLVLFKTEEAAKNRAAKFYGYEDYEDARNDGWCDIVQVNLALDKNLEDIQ